MAEKMRRIATEEAFSIPEVAAELQRVVRGPSSSLDKLLVKGIYDHTGGDPGYGRMNFLDGLLDVEDRRLSEMDRYGVDMQLLSLTAPGIQLFDADTATDLAALANDRLAEICRGHPTRFAGLAAFAPHSPKRAAEEMERAIRTLKGPLQDYGMDSAMWGYGVEVGTHIVRMMAAGVFDRFPKLMIRVGHMGEAIPFWIWRITFMNSRAQGLDRVLWAIDYPYQPTKAAVQFMDCAPVTDAQRHKLYHENAERIFHIAPLPGA